MLKIPQFYPIFHGSSAHSAGCFKGQNRRNAPVKALEPRAECYDLAEMSENEVYPAW